MVHTTGLSQGLASPEMNIRQPSSDTYDLKAE